MNHRSFQILKIEVYFYQFKKKLIFKIDTNIELFLPIDHITSFEANVKNILSYKIEGL